MSENIYIITLNGVIISAHRDDPMDILHRYKTKAFIKYCKKHKFPRTKENRENYFKVFQWGLEETSLEEKEI